MAYLELRKFNFFDLKKDVDNGRIASILQDSAITAFSSGNGEIILCDSVGFIHLVDKSWKVITFRGYETTIHLSAQLKESSLFVTIGEDEPGVNSVVKVWDTSKPDKYDAPMCVRILRPPVMNSAMKESHATALCVHNNLLAVGMSDGSVWLRRGDLTRDRGSRQRTMINERSPAITGLAIRVTPKQTYLFVATSESVFLYNITTRDKEERMDLDNCGCAPKCSILADTLQDCHFMTGRKDAVYCYTPDGRGGCFAVEGEKVMLDWFRSYLVIVARGSDSQNANLVTVLDVQNKFIVFFGTIPRVQAVLNEWGGFYFIGGNNEVYHLDEKDLQSKLSLLFKRNMYDISIRMAKSQGYDSDGLIDIFRQYGDHLYTKGDHAGAVEQYIKTIGKLEASYVIRKFLDSQHIDKLTMYLQALHKKGQATEDHTTLLLNCYTKLDHRDKLKEFILAEDRAVDFDIDIAMRVCRRASSEDALILAKRYGKHDWYLKIQIEDLHKYADALDYIKKLNFEDAETYMKKYGKILVENEPAESTSFLKRLCTDYYPVNKSLVSEKMLDGNPPDVEKCQPDDFIPLFLNNTARLVEFLEHLVEGPHKYSPVIYDTLIENYVNLWSSDNVVDKNKIEGKILQLLQNSDAGYDKNQALVICQTHIFSPGVLYLYQEAKLYSQILRHHMRVGGDMQAALSVCTRFESEEPTLWLHALWYCTRDETTCVAAQDIIPEILNAINQKRLLSPLLVLDCLCSSPAINLKVVRKYLQEVLQTEIELTKQEHDDTLQYREDTQQIREHIRQLRDEPTVFRATRCAVCHHQLELPAVHFMCQHSYHQHCFQSFSDTDMDCLACQRKNKELNDMIKSQRTSRDLHEKFHSQLERAEDSFSLLADYFRRGVFNKVTLVTDTMSAASSDSERYESLDFDIDFNKPKFDIVDKPNYGPGAENRIRLTEGQKQAAIVEHQKPSQRINHSSSKAIDPTSEGRMRFDEQRRYEQPTQPRADDVNYRLATRKVKTPVRSSEQAPGNPFESSQVPGNPFESDEVPGNPFETDDDKLNPFLEDLTTTGQDNNKNPTT